MLSRVIVQKSLFKVELLRARFVEFVISGLSGFLMHSVTIVEMLAEFRILYDFLWNKPLHLGQGFRVSPKIQRIPGPCGEHEVRVVIVEGHRIGSYGFDFKPVNDETHSILDDRDKASYIANRVWDEDDFRIRDDSVEWLVLHPSIASGCENVFAGAILFG